MYKKDKESKEMRKGFKRAGGSWGMFSHFRYNNEKHIWECLNCFKEYKECKCIPPKEVNND